MEAGIGDVLDRPREARLGRRRHVQPAIGHAQVDGLVTLEIRTDVERQTDKTAIVGRALARELASDLDLERAVGEIAVHDGEARPIAAACGLQTQLLLAIGQLDGEAVAAVPFAMRRRHQIGPRVEARPMPQGHRRMLQERRSRK